MPRSFGRVLPMYAVVSLTLSAMCFPACKTSNRASLANAGSAARVSPNPLGWPSQRLVGAYNRVNKTNFPPNFEGLTQISRLNTERLETSRETWSAEESRIVTTSLQLRPYIAHNFSMEAIEPIFSSDQPTLQTKNERDGLGSAPSEKSFGKYYAVEDRFIGAYDLVFATVGSSAGRDMYGVASAHLSEREGYLWGSTGAAHGFIKNWYLSPEGGNIGKEEFKATVENDPKWTPPDRAVAAFAEISFVGADFSEAIAYRAIELLRKLPDPAKRADAIAKLVAIDPERQGMPAAVEAWWKVANEYRIAYMEAKYEGSYPLERAIGIEFADQATFNEALKALARSASKEKIELLMAIRGLNDVDPVLKAQVDEVASREGKRPAADDATQPESEERGQQSEGDSVQKAPQDAKRGGR